MLEALVHHLLSVVLTIWLLGEADLSAWAVEFAACLPGPAVAAIGGMLLIAALSSTCNGRPRKVPVRQPF